MKQSLPKRLIHFHMTFCATLLLSDHLQVSTLTPTKLAYTSAKHAQLNYLEVKQSFIQGVVGHLFTPHQQMMLSS